MKRLLIVALLTVAGLCAQIQPPLSVMYLHFTENVLNWIGNFTGQPGDHPEHLMVFIRSTSPGIAAFQVAINYRTKADTPGIKTMVCQYDAQHPATVCDIPLEALRVDSVLITPLESKPELAILVAQPQR